MNEQQEEYNKKTISVTDLPPSIRKQMAAEVNDTVIQDIQKNMDSEEERCWEIFGDLLYGRHDMEPDYSGAITYLGRYIDERAKNEDREHIYMQLFIQFSIAAEPLQMDSGNSADELYASFAARNYLKEIALIPVPGIVKENTQIADWCAAKLEESTNSPILVMIGKWYFKRGDYERSLKMAQRVIQLHKDGQYDLSEDERTFEDAKNLLQDLMGKLKP